MRKGIAMHLLVAIIAFALIALVVFTIVLSIKSSLPATASNFMYKITDAFLGTIGV